MLAVRPHDDRASVVLPSVTCSSCSVCIPLSSLGEHICIPPKSIGARSTPRPSQIAIPTHTSTSSAGSWRGPSSLDRAPPRPAFAGPSSVKSSPGSRSLNIPDMSHSPIEKLSPNSATSGLYGSHSPSPRTPSPTNPFFPSLPYDNKTDYGLGLTVPHRAEGPFPTDAPLPAGISDLSGLNTASGMAGVGRRAFQAAAWGVTAGITMAANVRNKQSPVIQSNPPGATIFSQPRSAGPTPSSLPPWQQHLQQEALPTMPPAGRPRSNTTARGSPNMNLPPPSMPPRSASAMDRPAEPVIAPPRANSAMAKNPPSASKHRTKPSIASTTSSRSSYDANVDSISQLLKARTMERKGSNDKTGFFDKYKEMQRSASQSSHGTSRLLPTSQSRRTSQSDNLELVESPRQSLLDIDDERSALPWATPALGASPEITQGEYREKKHTRQNTAESGSSSGSSARYGASAQSSSEVVTPSQSVEGPQHGSRNHGRYDSRPLNQIHEAEEDENERVVFGHAQPPADMSRSETASTVTTKGPNPHAQSRSRTAPVKRIKTCQKCGMQVGGPKKFVERDGVVLCEADWKKMYLPTCRKCDKLIETKMVSADDGQLKGKWHSACFTCTRCDQPFEGGDFYVHAGKPWCQYHYAQETGTLCASSDCRRPIEGACILTQGSNPQRYHPGHLKCDHYGCQDAMEEYYDVGSQRFCERHVRVATQGRSDREGRDLRAEKRKTRLVDIPRGGF